MRHLMSPLDLSTEELEKILDLASDIEKDPKKYAHLCDDKRLATLFYEPSTRTRLSFEAAMIPVPHPREKVLLILSGLFPVMQIFVRCAILKRELLLLLLLHLTFL